MPKSRIAAVLYRMKKQRTNLITIKDELFTADELLSQLLGREVSETEGQEFITR